MHSSAVFEVQSFHFHGHSCSINFWPYGIAERRIELISGHVVIHANLCGWTWIMEVDHGDMPSAPCVGFPTTSTFYRFRSILFALSNFSRQFQFKSRIEIRESKSLCQTKSVFASTDKPDLVVSAKTTFWPNYLAFGNPRFARRYEPRKLKMVTNSKLKRETNFRSESESFQVQVDALFHFIWHTVVSCGTGSSVCDAIPKQGEFAVRSGSVWIASESLHEILCYSERFL